VLLAAEVARLTVAFAVADDNPELALRLAPSAPAALASTAMGQVGAAAAQGGDPEKVTFDQLRSVAQADPLRTEPFLVAAAMAERAGAYDRAKHLLIAAKSRDPRSSAARYLYADTAVREGLLAEGLNEMAVLSRLIPGAAIQLVPALAQFARTPGSHDKLAGILAHNPQLKNPLLIALASDPDNGDLITSLAGPPTPSPDRDTTTWQSQLLRGLVGRGEYERAYDLWRRFAMLPRGERPLLFNGSFRQIGAPPPFNWGLPGSGAGIAEIRNGKLRVLYYGRQDTTLASQLLLLPAGTYRFGAPMEGNMAAGALSWSISCLGAKSPLMELRLGSGGQPAGNFTVPAAGCAAQKIDLVGHLQDSPENSDVQIGPAAIQRIGG
jgi:hypothetical protein